MNAAEGVRRICVAMRWAGKAALLLAIAASIWALIVSDGGFRNTLEAIIAILGSGAGFMGFCYLIAWIAEGFAAPKSTR